MDEAGVDYMVLSLTSPGIQEIGNAALAESLATQANNDFAALIANNTGRFGAFAALSMHNATQAAEELRRCVQELGFHGALLNDFQQVDYDNRKNLRFLIAAYTVLTYERQKHSFTTIARPTTHSGPWLLSSMFQSIFIPGHRHLL